MWSYLGCLNEKVFRYIYSMEHPTLCRLPLWSIFRPFMCVCVYIFLTKKAEIENKASPLPFLTIALNMYRKYPHSRNFLRQLFIVFDNSLTKHLELRSALYAMYKTEKWVLYPRHSVFSHSVL